MANPLELPLSTVEIPIRHWPMRLYTDQAVDLTSDGMVMIYTDYERRYRYGNRHRPNESCVEVVNLNSLTQVKVHWTRRLYEKSNFTQVVEFDDDPNWFLLIHTGSDDPDGDDVQISHVRTYNVQTNELSEAIRLPFTFILYIFTSTVNSRQFRFAYWGENESGLNCLVVATGFPQITFEWRLKDQLGCYSRGWDGEFVVGDFLCGFHDVDDMNQLCMINLTTFALSHVKIHSAVTVPTFFRRNENATRFYVNKSEPKVTVISIEDRTVEIWQLELADLSKPQWLPLGKFNVDPNEEGFAEGFQLKVALNSDCFRVLTRVDHNRYRIRMWPLQPPKLLDLAKLALLSSPKRVQLERTGGLHEQLRLPLNEVLYREGFKRIRQ